MKSTRSNDSSEKGQKPNLIRKANKHDLADRHPDWAPFFWVWPWNNEAGLTFITCIQQAAVWSRNCSSTSFPKKESACDPRYSVGSLLSNQLTRAQTSTKCKCPESCFHVAKLGDEDLRAAQAGNFLGLAPAVLWGVRMPDCEQPSSGSHRNRTLVSSTNGVRQKFNSSATSPPGGQLPQPCATRLNPAGYSKTVRFA